MTRVLMAGSLAIGALLASGDPVSAQIVNTATATGTPAAGTLTDPTATESVTVVVATPRIAVVKTGTVDVTGGADAGNLDAGDTITYNYTISNEGNVTLHDISLAELSGVFTGSGPDPVPGGAAGGSFVGGAAGIRDLEVGGADITYTATYTILQADIDRGSVINQARATGTPASGGGNVTDDSDNANTGPADNTATTTPLAGAPRIAIVKTATQNPGVDGILHAGDTITYTYTVSNEGTVTALDITVAENVGDFTGNGVLPTPAYLSGGTFEGGNAGDRDIAVGGAPIIFEATYTVVQGDIDDGDIANQATASADTPSGGTVTDESDESGTLASDNDPTETDIDPMPVLTLTKVADDDTLVTAGQVITYTYVATNTGNVPINNVTISDSHNGSGPTPVPGNETLTDNGTPGDSTNTVANDGTINVLAPQDVATYTATYTVTQTDVDTRQ